MNSQLDQSTQSDDGLLLEDLKMAVKSKKQFMGEDRHTEINHEDSAFDQTSIKNVCKKKIKSKVKFRHNRQKFKQTKKQNVHTPDYPQQKESEIFCPSSCEEKTSTDSLEIQVFNIYITSDKLQNRHEVNNFADTFRTKMRDVIGGKMRVRRTSCGIIVTLYSEEDVERVLKTDLAKVQGIPVQATKLLCGSRYKRILVLKNLPWCISVKEIRSALKAQGISPGSIERTSWEMVKVEVFNASEVERLLVEGFNFYNCATYPATLDNPVGSYLEKADIVQCYRCQDFWHTSSTCRNPIRCVRCGGNHDVDRCTRDRSDAVCCHCGGRHHAACKTCPVRLQMAMARHMGFTLTSQKSRFKFVE